MEPSLRAIPRWLIVTLLTAALVLPAAGVIIASLSNFTGSEVTVWATLTTGVATAALVVVTALLVSATSRTIEESKELGRATARLADEAAQQTSAANRSIEESQRLVTATNRLAQEASEEAAAATAEAAASAALLEEVRKDRELAYRPFLAFSDECDDQTALTNTPSGTLEALFSQSDAVQSVTGPLRVQVSNIGKGLAVDCQYFGHFTKLRHGTLQFEHSEYASRRFAVGAEVFRPTTLEAFQLQDNGPPPVIADLVEQQPDEVGEILVCRDQFDKKYRFVRGAPLPQIWPDDYEGKPRPLWPDQVGKDVPVRFVQAPSAQFLNALSFSMTTRPYIVVVAQGVPDTVGDLTDAIRGDLRKWMLSIQPAAQMQSNTRRSVSYLLPDDGDVSSPRWVAEIRPGPLISVRELAPVRVNGRVDFLVDQCVAWWSRLTGLLLGLLTRL